MSDEKATVKLKLIGAETYACRPAGLEFPVHAGDIADVFADKADHLLAQTYRVDSHEYPVWTKDLKAEVKTKGQKVIPIEQRQAMEAAEAERNAEMDALRKEKEEAVEREEELQRRVAKLEALFDAQESAGKETTTAAPAKKRKKAASRTAA